MKIPYDKLWMQLILLIIVSTVVGSTFIMMKRGLVVYSFYEVAAMRIFFASIILSFFSFHYLKKLTKLDWYHLALVGVIGNAVPFFLVAKSQTGIDSSLGGMLNTLLPLLTLLTGVFFFRLRPTLLQVLGVFIGLVGAVGLIHASTETAPQMDWYYAFFMISGTACFAFNINVINKKLEHVPPVIISSVAFMIIGPIAAIYLIWNGTFNKMITIDTDFSSLKYVLALAIIGTAIIRMIFYTIIKKTSPLFASSLAYAVPVVAIGFGLADGEKISWEHIAFILVIFIAVYMTTRKKPDVSGN